jgi:hemolysin activation/secretion protein
MKPSTFLTSGAALGILMSTALPALAQTPPVIPQYNIGDAVREADQARREAPPQTTAAPILPRLVEPQFTLKDKSTLFVRHFRIDGPFRTEGQNLVSEAEVEAIVAPYENRTLTLALIYEAADKITSLYRERGYLVAKAYVPAQDARGGVLRIKVVPGRYGDITVNNQSRVRDPYLRAYIDHALAGSEYIEKDRLERAMLLLSDLPGTSVPRVTIASGRQPETSDFVFDVPQGRLFDGYVLADNFGSPYTGRDRVSGGLNLNSPLGIGDRFSLFGIVSEESELINGRVAYSLPIGFDGLRAEISAFRTTYALGDIYRTLNSTGTATGESALLTYAFKRTRDDSIYLTGGYTHKVLNDNVLGFSIADRTIDLGTIGIERDTVGAIFGLPLATSTTFAFTGGNVDIPDPVQRALNVAGVDTVGNYGRLNLNFLGTLALSDKFSFSTNLKAQASLGGKNLDSSEQLSLTGFFGVRSFDEGLAADSGFVVTPELRYALPDFYNYHQSACSPTWRAAGSQIPAIRRHSCHLPS